jgi:hypothetical protein
MYKVKQPNLRQRQIDLYNALRDKDVPPEHPITDAVVMSVLLYHYPARMKGFIYTSMSDLKKSIIDRLNDINTDKSNNLRDLVNVHIEYTANNEQIIKFIHKIKSHEKLKDNLVRHLILPLIQ